MGKLPSPKLNGLARIAAALVKDPKGTHLIVAVIDAGKIEKDTDTGEQIPHVRFRQVEVISLPDAIEDARRLLVQATDDRLGRIAIPGIDEAMLSDLERIERLVMDSPEKDDEDEDPEETGDYGSQS
jgi:hypothetical protein